MGDRVAPEEIIGGPGQDEAGRYARPAPWREVSGFLFPVPIFFLVSEGTVWLDGLS
jgi:hypothetical protein